jgi:hypothetical protein
VPSYLIETYLARGVPGERASREQRARSAAEASARVRFERSIHLPEDELCFYVFEAPSGRDATRVAQQAGLDPLRVVEAIPSDHDNLDRKEKP